MRVYYDDNGKMIGCNNMGHVPDGAAGFTNELPQKIGMRWDFINDGLVGAPKEPEMPLEIEDLPEMGEPLPLVSGENHGLESFGTGASAGE